MAAASVTKLSNTHHPRRLLLSRRRRYWMALKETIEWRLIAIAIDFVVLFVITGRVAVAVSFASVDLVVKTLAFYGWRYTRGRGK